MEKGKAREKPSTSGCGGRAWPCVAVRGRVNKGLCMRTVGSELSACVGVGVWGENKVRRIGRGKDRTCVRACVRLKYVNKPIVFNLTSRVNVL